MIILGITSSSDKNAPTAPTIGTAVNVGTGRAYNNGAATVPFTPGSTGGLSVTYTATSSPGGFTASGSSSPLTVTGLQSNTAYTFTVTATNSLGSATSAASNSITATTVPQAPTIGTATDGGTGTTVSVAFTPGATGGSAVTTYTATSSPGSITGTAASSPITVSGLTTGQAYTFTVTATNANGTSQASAASNSVTPAVPNDFEYITGISADTGINTYTISSIPQTYRAIAIYGKAISTSSGTAMNLRINGDTTNSYNYTWISQYLNNASQVQFSTSQPQMELVTPPSNGTPSFFKILITNYTATNTYYGLVYEGGAIDNTPAGRLQNQVGFLTNFGAITSLTFRVNGGNMNDVRISLYGYK